MYVLEARLQLQSINIKPAVAALLTTHLGKFGKFIWWDLACNEAVGGLYYKNITDL
jgi:hypothetical protein